MNLFMKRLRIAAFSVMMTLCTILSSPCVFATQARQEPVISISAKNLPLREFIAAIEKKCNYTFFYSVQVLEKAGNVSVEAENLPVSEVLEKALAGTGCTFEVLGNKIAIKTDAKSATMDNGNSGNQTKDDAPANSGQTAHVVSGIVKDSQGQPMPGVGVLIEGTATGVITDNDGVFAISVLPEQQLRFSSMGYKDEVVKVGSRSELNIRMMDDVQVLESVVVTAFGMKRDEKSLGYATTKVDGANFSNAAASSNWLGGLAGKVAGLAIDRTNSGPGGSMRVTLRGESSVDLANNSALFVIDGVPMFNTSTSSTAGGDDSTFSIDYGDGTGDVNPDDIENITVLKGPAATALYGSNAANGAIIITTKSGGNQDSKISVSYNTNVMFETLATSPDLQYEYGQGSNPDYYYYLKSGDALKGSGYNPVPDYKSTVSLESWGPMMDGSLQYQYYDDRYSIGGTKNEEGDFLRTATPFVSHGDWFKDYFRTAYVVSNSLSVSGKINNKNSIRVTFSDTRGDMMVPNTNYNKQYISLKTANNLATWLSAETSVNFKRQQCDNIPTSSGYGSTSVMYSLWTYAPNVDMSWAKNYWLAGQEGIAQDTNLSGGKNNAYFIANECTNDQLKNRVYGNTKFDITFCKGLTLMLRGGLDMSNDFRTQRQATSTQANPDGWYREQNITSMQFTGDFLLKYDTELGADFHFTGNVGGNILSQNYRRQFQTADKLKQPGVYSLANSIGEIKVDNYGYKRQTNSLYALLQFSWKNAIFLDVTGRNDWSSTLPAENRSYFYPSVSASAALNDLFDFGRTNGLVNLMKVRASWAQVGHDTSAYRIEEYLASTKFPGGVALPSAKSNSSLKPEIVTSWEVGADIRMFRNRLKMDIAYYDGTSKNLIADMPVSYGTGASSVYTNAGTIRNWGMELTASGTLLKTNDIQLELGLNWSFNRNRVLSLGEGIDSWIVARYSSHALMTAYEGSSLTSMYGKGYKRAPEGSYAIGSDGMMQDVSGMVVLDKQGKPQTDEDLQYIGDCSPKWSGGFNLSFRWKDIKASVSFDGQYGGHVFSYTNWVLNYRGKGTGTLTGREGGMIAEGVVLMDDGNYKINDYAIPRNEISEYYHSAFSNTNAEANFVSTQFLKLREARIEYSFPKKLLARTRVIRGLSVAIYGNNLFCWSEFPGWDPEGVSMRGSAIIPGFEILQMPSGAQYGANLKITF